jgi:hypothetical protein
MLASGTQDRGLEPGRSRRIFSGGKIHSMPSFGGEVKPSVQCRRFAACERTLRFIWKLESADKIDRPFLSQFRSSLTELSHVAWRAAPLEMTDGTKGGAQRARSLWPRCFGDVDSETATHICLSVSQQSVWYTLLHVSTFIHVIIRELQQMAC